MKAPQEDREKLVEALAKFRGVANRGFGTLKRLVKPKGTRGGDHTEADNPPTGQRPPPLLSREKRSSPSTLRAHPRRRHHLGKSRKSSADGTGS